MAAVLRIRHFTDPACPWAFSAEPVRRRIGWLFGAQIAWEHRMVVLSSDPDDYLARGFTPERQAEALRKIQRDHAMPIDPRPRPRMAATEPACRAVVAARLRAPERHEALLRRLRVLAMAGGLLDDPALIARAAGEAGLDPDELRGWCAEPEVKEALREDYELARRPRPGAVALEHRLASTDEGMRYTCPSYEIVRLADGATAAIPGFQPWEAYEVAIANLAPDLHRREPPESASEALAWAGEPLAAAEVAALLGTDLAGAREQLARVAVEEPVGAEGWWRAAERVREEAGAAVAAQRRRA